MKPNKKQFLSGMGIILFAFFLCCTKKNKTADVAQPAIPKITQVNYYSDKHLIVKGDTVHFSCSANGTALTSNSTISCTWYFGDGDSSKLIAPYHIYTDTGNFTTTLQIRDTVYNVISSPYNKVIVCNNPLYTADICKLRIWQGEKKIVKSGATTSNTDNIIHDTSFSLRFVDKLTIHGINDMKYSPARSGANQLFFINDSVQTNSEQLRYDIATDSVYYEYHTASYDHTGREFYTQPTTLTEVQVWYHSSK